MSNATGTGETTMDATMKTITTIAGFGAAVCLLWAAPLSVLVVLAVAGVGVAGGITLAEWTEK